ncbi:2-oxoglutarate dehydrogenase E1 component [Bartonella sp. DGB1]|uniref:2-oxoglutarate dehydrogenase E1 component n=1 Tax=Bartonella sp. DGB1 TaxID=3239807 RepID=UPI0035245371
MSRQDKANDIFNETSFLYGSNASYIDQLYAQYKINPESVEAKWREFFSGLQDNDIDVKRNARGATWGRSDSFQQVFDDMTAAIDGNWSKVEKKLQHNISKDSNINEAELAAAVSLALKAKMLIHAYRTRGHMLAKIDPLDLYTPEPKVDLSLENFGFTEDDIKKEVFVDGFLGFKKLPLITIEQKLKEIYCSSIGYDYAPVTDAQQLSWLITAIENNHYQLTVEDKKQLFQKLVEAEGFELFLDVKYKGAKRFGLDGGEVVVSALEYLMTYGSSLGISEFVIGMAHRGRLNVLSQIIKKPPHNIFYEFKGGSCTPDNIAGSGDVKYHLGASADLEYNGKKVHVSLSANPSHLEIVNPVILGKARAKQDKCLTHMCNGIEPLPGRECILPVLLHGDAAFAGQGVVAEIMALSNLSGYTVAGSVHIIINNQIGFTTNPNYSRSSTYSSDVVKMIEAPVLHVNGDDVESVIRCVRLAIEYRMHFKRPIVLDIYCYRRFGHNEMDEPNFTQPLMYKTIRSHKSVLKIYSEKLVSEGVITAEEADAAKKAWRKYLDDEFEKAETYVPNTIDMLEGAWKGLRVADSKDEYNFVNTGVALKKLKEIALQLTEVPSDFSVHRTVQRFLDARRKAVESGENIDWATAEALAFGSLLTEGYSVRLSGQDVERGTFSQRHSVLYDQVNNSRYVPLNNLSTDNITYQAINSLLSEEAVLGYEYGYSLSAPKVLTLWEAQFGDFANGAQVIFDQFISSAETKWLRMSGLVCLLPHGYEGQGPEHSSARLERYLQLCAEGNMQVANCTTPANYFHILRRQMIRDFRKPLILMTPKSLLRHKRAVSSLIDMATDNQFQRILLDDAQSSTNSKIKLVKDTQIRRVVICSGKVYYDLYEEREKRGIDNVYLLRIEQLYPFPSLMLEAILSRFSEAEIFWCQEEPKNMGAWTFVKPYIDEILAHIGMKKPFISYTGRAAAASTATGFLSKHLEQLAEYLQDALEIK